MPQYVKTFAKILVGVFIAGLVCVVSFMGTVNYLHARSRREITRIVLQLTPGTPFSTVVSRLGKPSRTFTNTELIELWGTQKDKTVTTNSTLHMFMHHAIPLRWILVYTDKESQRVIYADWRDT